MENDFTDLADEGVGGGYDPAIDEPAAYVTLDFEGNEVSQGGPWRQQRGEGVETRSMKKRKKDKGEDETGSNKREKRDETTSSAGISNPTSRSVPPSTAMSGPRDDDVRRRSGIHSEEKETSSKVQTADVATAAVDDSESSKLSAKSPSDFVESLPKEPEESKGDDDPVSFAPSAVDAGTHSNFDGVEGEEPSVDAATDFETHSPSTSPTTTATTKEGMEEDDVGPDRLKFTVVPTQTKVFGRNSLKSFLFSSVNPSNDLDYEESLRQMESQVAEHIEKERETLKGDFKVHISVKAKYLVVKEGKVVDDPAFWFTAKSVPVRHNQPVFPALAPTTERFGKNIRDQNERGSGFVWSHIAEVSVSLARLQYQRGGSYRGKFHLPRPLATKHCLLNIFTSDGKCILDCISAARHPTKTGNRQAPSRYLPHRSEIDVGNLEFPLKIADISKLEKLNRELSVNVYSFQKCETREKKYKQGYKFFPLRVSDRREGEGLVIVDLLYCQDEFENEGVGHYCLIEDLSKLVRRSNSKSHTSDTFTCRYCLQSMKTGLRNSHVSLCEQKQCQATTLPEKGQNILEFKDASKAYVNDFVIIFDFETFESRSQNVSKEVEIELDESVPRKFDWIRFPSEEFHAKSCKKCSQLGPCEKLERSAKVVSSLRAFSFAYLITTPEGSSPYPMRMCQSPDVEEAFLFQLRTDSRMLNEQLRKNYKLDWTPESKRRFEAATECYICQKPFASSR